MAKIDTQMEIDQAVDENPTVVASLAAFENATREFEPVKARCEHLRRVAATWTDQQASEAQQPRPSPLERMRAQAELPEVQRQERALEVKLLDAAERLADARVKAADRLTTVRRQCPERKQLMRELFARLDEDIAPLVARIADFDRVTERLGGRSTEPVFAELDGRNPQSIVEFRRARWKAVGEL